MKQLIGLLLMALILNLSNAQNPFQSLGKESKVLTLSNGEYKEFHPNDSLRQIGSVIVNVRTGKIHALLSTINASGEVGPERIVVSRWFSVDPLANKTPSISPYASFNNNPIFFKDPDGQTGIASIHTVTAAEADKYGVAAGTKIVLVEVKYVFYGTQSQNFDAMSVASNIEKEWNGANGTVQIEDENGKMQTYSVKFNITAEEATFTSSDPSAQAEEFPKIVAGRRDPVYNFVRVEDPEGGAGSKTSGNAGYWTLDDLQGSKTESHELWEGLKYDPNQNHIEDCDTDPARISCGRNGVIDPSQRTATSMDVADFNLPTLLKGKKEGEKAYVGPFISDNYYDAGGVGVPGTQQKDRNEKYYPR